MEVQREYSVIDDAASSTVHGNSNASSAESSGNKKRRPASPEVIIDNSRPRTPSSTNGAIMTTSFDLPQSPTKKQRTESANGSIDLRLYRTGPFGASSAGPPSTSSATAGAAASLSSQDPNITSATETFAQLTTVTPQNSGQEASSSAPAERSPVPSRPSSKPTSPTARRRSMPVVEIYTSRPSSATKTNVSPTLKQHTSIGRNDRQDEHLPSISSDEALDTPFADAAMAGASSGNMAGEATHIHEASPELEEPPPSQARLRRDALRARSSDSADLHMTGSFENSQSTGSLAGPSTQEFPPSSQFRFDVSTSEDTSSSPKPIEASLSANLYNDPQDIWFARTNRKAAELKKSYTEQSSDIEDFDETVQALPKRKGRPPKKEASKASPRKGKGKGKAIDEDLTESDTLSESDAPLPFQSKGRGKAAPKATVSSPKPKPAKAATPQRKSGMTQSKSDGHIARKAKAGRKRADSDASSEPENFFQPPGFSPTKKRKIAAKPKTPSRKEDKQQIKASASRLAPRPFPLDSSGDELPELPFSSQPPPSSQNVDDEYYIHDLEDNILATIPIKSFQSNGHHSSSSHEFQDHNMQFWWPAKITSRNRENFTVTLVVDEPNSEILQYSEATVVIPKQQLNKDHLHKLSAKASLLTGATPSGSQAARHSASPQAHPSMAAFSAALQKALKQLWSDPVPKGKRQAELDMLSEAFSSDSDLDALRRGARTQVGSDFEDDASDIEVGAIGLAKDKQRWWPCRILKIERVPRNAATANQARAKRRKPYLVEFYPPSKDAYRSRKELVFRGDLDFFDVPLGEIQQKNKPATLEDDLLHSILPEMAQICIGQYRATNDRHNTFFDNPAARGALAKAVSYGGYEEPQIKKLTDFLCDWIFGRLNNAVPPLPANARVNESETGGEMLKMDYAAMVLLPGALELLMVQTDEDIPHRAMERLREKGQESPTDDDIRAEAHRIAKEELHDSAEWWEDIYNLRQRSSDGDFMRDAANSMLEEADHLAAIGDQWGDTRRKTNRVSYKE